MAIPSPHGPFRRPLGGHVGEVPGLAGIKSIYVYTFMRGHLGIFLSVFAPNFTANRENIAIM
jgi:hypothetical protein